jgi:hypothetical protein
MDYEVSVAEKDSFIVCVVSGPILREDARKYSSEMIVLAQARGIKRFLFDVREAQSALSILGNYKFAHEDLTELGFPRFSRVAILRTADDASHDFIEKVSRNAGYLVRLFVGEADAIAWLEQ